MRYLETLVANATEFPNANLRRTLKVEANLLEILLIKANLLEVVNEKASLNAESFAH